MKDQKQEVGDTSKSDISSTDNKNNSNYNFSYIANNSDNLHNSPQIQNEVEEVKNQEQDDTQQVLRNENESSNVQVDNEFLSDLNKLIDFIRRGKFEKIKPIIDGLSIEKFKEVVKAHTDSDWNLFHYAAKRGNLEILDLLYSKLADNSEQNLALNLLREKDEFGKTPYNVAQDNNKDGSCKMLLSLVGDNETLKEEIINEAIMHRHNHYKPSEKLVEGLEKRIREEMMDNEDNLPYFEDVKKAIDWGCNSLAKQMITNLKDELQDEDEKILFFTSHGDYGWNLLHFTAAEGDTDILKTLCMFDLELTKKIAIEQNEDGKYPYHIAREKHYDDFCSEIKKLMGEEFNNIDHNLS